MTTGREWIVGPFQEVQPMLVYSAKQPPWDEIGSIHLPDPIRDLFVSSETGHLLAVTDFAMYRIVDGKRMRVKKVKT